MVFGGVEVERLQLNEETLWSGPPGSWIRPDALDALEEVRSLIEQQHYEEADLKAKSLMGPYTQSYVPLGELELSFMHGDITGHYERSLELSTAASRVRYTIGEVTYTRELIASYTDQVIAIHMTADSPRMLNLTARLTSQLRYSTTWTEDRLIMNGVCPNHVDPNYVSSDRPIVYDDEHEQGEAIRFSTAISAKLDVGTVWVDHDGLHIREATSVTLLLTAASDYAHGAGDPSRPRNRIDPKPRVMQLIDNAMRRTYEEIRASHETDYRRLFDRVQLKLGSDRNALFESKTTDDRIRAFDGADLGLVELLFQYGRYLLICCSRPGTLPANLQGIWNREMRAPWSSNYTLNINTQMNYWLSETCNLAECHEPLLSFIERLASNGRHTAQMLYGCRGWTAHHNADIWGHTSPVGDDGHGDAVWAIWPMGGVWLCQHLWEHYCFGRDTEYLQQFAYPIMREAARFCLDWLIENEAGQLMTSPSTSPEHKFRTASGGLAGLAQSTASDLALIWDLFTNCIEASEVLGIDDSLSSELTVALHKLRPYQIGKYGQLQEWGEDYEDEDQHHRHLSPLIGVHPGRQLTAAATPEWFEAARVLLKRRGDGGTGWSLAWKVNMWARFRDGDRASDRIHRFITLVEEDSLNYHSGGVYPNLLSAHPPFQIDGNFGVTAGIAELLLQSHDDELTLLPALPSGWREGSVNGLRARGGYVVAMSWSNGRLVRAEVFSSYSGACRIRPGVPVRSEFDGVELADTNGIVVLQMKAGQTVELVRSSGE